LSIPCPDRESLQRLLDGQLRGDEANRLADHLEDCENCAGLADSLKPSDALVLALQSRAASIDTQDPVLKQLVSDVSQLFERAADDTASGHAGASTTEISYAGLLAPPERDDEIGRLGAFRVLRVLGTGGMGIVFLAEEIPLSRPVALKIIKPELAGRPWVRERFFREARAIAAVEDERIITIHHVGEDRGVPYIAMPLLRGQTLEERLREVEQAGSRQGLPIEEAVRIGRDIAAGLAAAHARGVIHRDVKPGNVFLKDGTTVKLLDFGLARITDDVSALTQTALLAGTPAYVAPEQCAGDQVDWRADLYGLGCTLYRMTTGRTPFGSVETVLRGAHAPVPPHELDSGVPSELSELIVELLAKNPADRPASAGEVAERLSQIAPDLSASDSSRRGEISANRSSTATLLRTAAPILALTIVLVVIILQYDSGTGRLTVEVQQSGSPALPAQNRKPAEPAPLKESPFSAWLQHVADLSGEEQAQAVADKLRELNPGFDGKFGPRYVGGRVVEYHFFTDEVTDISPVRALPELEILVCRGSAPSRGRLVDLSPVRTLRSLVYLDCSANQIQDLQPLKGLALRELVVWANPVSDISAVRTLPLTMFDIDYTYVSDLTPLRGMPLMRLQVKARYIADLSPLEGLPLMEIKCDFRPYRFAQTLRRISTLRTINEKPAGEFWKEHDTRQAALDEWIARTTALSAEQQVEQVTAKFQELNPEFKDRIYPTIEEGKIVKLMVFVNKVTDISPVRALTELKYLTVRSGNSERAQFFDLDPIRDLKLEYLECGGTSVAELTALAGSSIRVLSCWGTWVQDLAPLKGLPIFFIDCRSSAVSSLSPLRGIAINQLYARDCAISDFSPLRDLPLRIVEADFDLARDADILRSIKSLQQINGKPTEEFWKTMKQE
jgi:eukaryotic-like serine/threonine-protein kinase